MTSPIVLIAAVLIAAASIWGAAYLLSLWHEDRDEQLARGRHPGWPLSRVLAYLAIGATLASTLLGVLTLLRLIAFPSFREIQVALSPLTVTALLYLDVVFTVLAVYLRVIRRRTGQRPL